MEAYLLMVELLAGIGLFGVALDWYAGSRMDTSPLRPRVPRRDTALAGSPEPLQVVPSPTGQSATACANSSCKAPLAGPEDGQPFLVPVPGTGQPRRVVLCARCAGLVVSRAHLRTQLEGIRLGDKQ